MIQVPSILKMYEPLKKANKLKKSTLFQPSWEAIAAALRARSLDFRWALAARVLICFSRLISFLSLRFPMKISFQYFYQTCHAMPGFMAIKHFSVLLYQL
jgi:hypothetical protein